MSYIPQDASLQLLGLQNSTSIYQLRSDGLTNQYYVVSGDGTRHLMASPEKALCDYLYTRKDLRIYSPKTLASYLEEEVRFDFDSFEHYDPAIFSAYAACGYKPDLFKAAERLFK